MQERIKESSNKLCRLFKENKNLSDDNAKVKNEQNELNENLKEFIVALKNENFDEFQSKIENILEDMNALEKMQKKEKVLLQTLKESEQQLQYEIQNMNQET